MEDPDWVPSKNLGYDVERVGMSSQPESADLLNAPVNDEVVDVPVEAASINSKSTQTFVSTSSTGIQTDDTITGIKGIQTDDTFTGMSDEILMTYVERINLLEEMLDTHNVALKNFDGQDKKTKFFTGLSNFETMKALFELLEPEISFSKKLTSFQIFFIVLTRLRLNLSFRYLSYQFNVAAPTISKHFHKFLLAMYKKLKSLVYWPTRESIKKTTPLSFQSSFGDSIVVILDCFEIFIEKPATQKALAQCYSQYKHAYTIKYLVGITPQGFISFISKGYGGRSSDKFVTESSGLLDKLNIGDVVMTDRGFLIEEELLHRGVELRIPAFTKGKKQLHPRDIENTRNIANVRIHVERVIGQLRQKFTILHQYKFPISLIKKKAGHNVSVIDQIVSVCSALSNLCSPIVCKVSKDDTL